MNDSELEAIKSQILTEGLTEKRNQRLWDIQRVCEDSRKQGAPIYEGLDRIRQLCEDVRILETNIAIEMARNEH